MALLFAAACGKHEERVHFTEQERQTADSIVRSVEDIAAARALTDSYRQSGDILGQMVSLRQLGKLYREESMFLQAIDCHQQGLQIATDAKDTLEMTMALNNIGTNYRRLGSLEEAASFHQQAIVLSAEYSDQSSFQAKKNRVVGLNGMGNVLLSLGDMEMADSVFRMALAGERALGSALGQAINLANLGAIKEKTGQSDSARIYYKQSLDMNQLAGSMLGIGLCHLHFGQIDEQNGLLDRAIGEYQKAYDLLQQVGDEWHWLDAILNIARVHIKNGSTDEAKALIDQASQTVERIGSQEHQVVVYRLYYQLYEKTGQLRKALDNYILSASLEDSLVNIKKLNNIQNQRLAIERMRRQHELEMAQENLALEHSEKTTTIVAAIALLLLAAVVTVAMGYQLHTRTVKQRITQQMQQTRESFFTNITHEFRTPLTVILGMGHQLEDQEHEDMAQVRSAAKMIVRQGNSLLGLINQLLDISKVRSAVGEPKWQHGNIVAFVEMTIEYFRPYAESKRQELTFSHSLTSLDMDFVPDYMERIISNLVTNSIKYTPSYGKVNVTLEQSGTGRMKLQVFDTGRGIKAEVLPHIFDAFFQGETQDGDVGSGVGLSLVRLMVEGMNGTISAESIEGQGSTFTVMLPMKTAHPLSKGGEQLAPSHESSANNTVVSKNSQIPSLGEGQGVGSWMGLTILIVEDNQDIAHYIGLHLKDCRLLYARGGEEGLLKAQETMPDLIITDIMMPGEVDGLELCRQVRASELLCHIPIIVITAKTTEADRIRGLEAGADAYLVKPFNSEELLVRVRKLLERQEKLRNKYQQIGMDEQESTPATELKPQDRQFMNHLVDVVYRLMASGNVDMDSVASEMAVSRTQLNRKILAITGQNSSAYIMQLRLARAKRLLKADENTPIGNVALRCGFDDVAYFSRIFKQTFQMTPSQYRKQNI